MRQIGLEMSSDTRTFFLRYVGARFEGHRLPLDVLPDLSAFRDLLVFYVKAKWRATHEKRVRLPKGFERSIAFDLTEIGDGSAIPKLEWDRQTAQLLLPDFKDELESLVEHAYTQVIELIDGAAEDIPSAGLPPESIRALNRFGSGLFEGEKIEFLGSKGKDGNVVYLDSYRRKRLITRGHDSYETRFEGIGKLLGSEKDADGINGRIVVDTEQHGTIRIPVTPERVKEEFDGSIDEDVQFRLQIELDNKDVFKRVVEVFDVDLIDAALVANLERCRMRIESIASLEDGWHNGVGRTVTQSAVMAAKRLLSARPRLAGSYHIYPTEMGGILFEFMHTGWDYSIEAGPNGKIEIFGVQVDGPNELDTKVFPSMNEDALKCLDGLTGGDQ
jgi:hypothetical protein